MDLRLRLQAIHSIAEIIKTHMHLGFGNAERVKHIISLSSAKAKDDTNDERGINSRVKGTREQAS